MISLQLTVLKQMLTLLYTICKFLARQVGSRTGNLQRYSFNRWEYVWNNITYAQINNQLFETSQNLLY